MKKMDFKVVKEGHDVSIVRVKSSAQRDSAHSTQRMRVICFDSAQVDRIFQIQEKSVNTTHRK
jgi:hypothetical protein